MRGNWVCREYLNRGAEGWFRTGDVCTIDADGFAEIVDRSKDVIKSGGEWISSIALENIAVSHPDVAAAAIVAARHPKWQERPLLLVVPRPGAGIDRDDLLDLFSGKIAKWWLPDDVVVVEELPHTATGKLNQLALRPPVPGLSLAIPEIVTRRAALSSSTARLKISSMDSMGALIRGDVVGFHEEGTAPARS